MGSVVTTGAVIACSFGASPATFAASGVSVDCTTSAGVVDDVAIDNISSFGLCSSPANPMVAAATAAAPGVLTPQPCLPVLSPWTPGADRVTLNGVPALDEESVCSCAWAGVVSVSYAGQEQVTAD